MNWEQAKGKWNQVAGAVKKQWGKLTDDALAIIGGQRDQLIGKIHCEGRSSEASRRLGAHDR